MELTLLIMCGVALLAGNCYSDVNIQQCPNGQKYVAEYKDVSLTCGPCMGIIEWYVDDNSGEEDKYVGECAEADCKVKNSAAFGLKVNTRNTQSFNSVLDILHFTNNNADHASFICECYHYFLKTHYGREGYSLQSMKSCKLLIKERAVPPGSPQLQCPETVLEGSNVSCKCTSANKGSPPAQFVWDGTNTDTLLLQEVGRQLNGMNYTCRQTWGRSGKFNGAIVYTLRVIENKEPPSENMKGGIVGGVVAAVVAIAIIGTIVTVYIVKRRKGMLCKGKINLGLFPCPSIFHRKKPISQSFEVVNRSQTPVLHYVAPSGDIYTIASTTASGDLDGEYVTVREILENTTPETDMGDNLQTNEELPDETETRTSLKPTIKSKPTTGEPRNFSDLSGAVYMNVTATQLPDTGTGKF